MIILILYFYILFFNVKMFMKSFDNLCGDIVYIYDLLKICIMLFF